MKQFWEILVYSYMERVRAKPFLISTLAAILLVAGLMNAPKIAEALSSGSQMQFAVIDKTGKLMPDVKEISQIITDYEWVVAKPEQEQELREQIKNKDTVEGFVLIEPETNAPPKVSVIVNRVSNPPMLDLLNQYVQNKYTLNVIQEMKLTPEQFSQITTNVALNVNEMAKNVNESFIIISGMIMLLYISIMFFCSNVATAVAAEKSSRIMEVLITKVRPLWLLYGKVIGVGLVGLTQIGIIGAVSYLVYKVSYSGPFMFREATIDFSILSTEVLVYFVIFYTLGYFFYSTLYAAVGSLVSRSEEVNQVMMPLTLVIMVAMFAALYAMEAPDGNFAVIGSQIPFLSPMLMLIRIGVTEVPTLQIWSSIAILIASSAIGCWVAAKIYRVGVLTYGKRPSAKEIMVAAKTYRV